MAREVIAGLVPEGVIKLLPDSVIEVCRYHILVHTPHLKCHDHANYQLIRPRHVNINLCTAHAREVRKRSEK
jgi:hypothetical protein